MHVIVCVVCVNFGNEILLRGEECKTWANYSYSIGWRLEIFRSRMMKWNSPLDSSHEI